VLADLNDFASVLDIAIARHESEVIALTVRSVSAQLQDLQDHYPDPAGSEITGGATERKLARDTIARLMELLQRADQAATGGNFDAAANEYLSYRKLTISAAPLALQAAESWSLFNPALHAARQQALRQAVAAKTVSR
jgi:hypothetical protein